jgi:hypothetical protein
MSKPKIQELEIVAQNQSEFAFANYTESFRLVLSYPLKREFVSRQDLIEQIGEFNSRVLKIDSYALLFRIDSVAVGELADCFLISFTGSMCGEYAEANSLEIVSLLNTLLASYFTCVRESELLPLYLQINEQDIFLPQAETPGIPVAYDRSVSFAQFIDSEVIAWSFLDLSSQIIGELLISETTVSAIAEATAIGVESSGEILASGAEVGVEIGVEVLSVVAESTGALWHLIFEFLLSLF